MLLKDKVAIITGSAAGIGEATARLFAAEGAKVILFDRDAARNEETARSIRAQYGFALPFGCDVSDGADVSAAVEAAISAAGRVDILINNAGIYPRRPFLSMSGEEWDEMQTVNLKSMFHCTRAVLPGMVERKAGWIVNISSITFHLGVANLSHYVTSKGGVIGLTRSLAREFGVHNIHINCITPGAIDVENEKNFVTQEQIVQMVAQQCLGRRILPEDVARVCAFLCSELADAMTGQVLNVDGGWYMH